MHSASFKRSDLFAHHDPVSFLLANFSEDSEHLLLRFSPTPQENALSYMQFRELVQTQLTYARDVHDTLMMAAQNI
jgi:hypothetical protein